MGLKFHDELKAAFIRHVDIGYDGVRSDLAQQTRCLLSVPGLDNLVAGFAKPYLKRPAYTRIVVDH